MEIVLDHTGIGTSNDSCFNTLVAKLRGATGRCSRTEQTTSRGPVDFPRKKASFLGREMGPQHTPASEKSRLVNVGEIFMPFGPVG